MPPLSGGKDLMNTVVRVRTSQGWGYCKRYPIRPGDEDDERRRRRFVVETAVLERLSSEPPGHPRLGSCMLEHIDPERREIVTREVPGDTLQDHLLASSRHARRRLLRGVFLAGYWLRHWQQWPLNALARESLVDNGASDLVAYCDIRIKRLQSERPRLLPPRLVDRIRKFVGDSTENAAELSEEMVWSHGDYAPGNIIWDGTTLTPIDFGMAGLDYPLTDITYFIHRVEMLTIYFPWKRIPVASIREAVLRGYGSHRDVTETAAYRALMIRHLLCRLVTHYQDGGSMARRIHREWILSRIVRHLASIVD